MSGVVALTFSAVEYSRQHGQRGFSLSPSHRFKSWVEPAEKVPRGSYCTEDYRHGAVVETKVMKGVVFTELLEMVEDKFGDEVVDEIIEDSDLPSGGAYTAVGTYDYQEIVSLVQALSNKTGVEIPVLLKAFGSHVFGCFVRGYPVFFVDADDAFDFLMNVEGYIHVEVRKLYPDAELPTFDGEILDDGHMRLHYTSPRPFADLAEGLIEGCGEHFGQPITIERKSEQQGDMTSVEFYLSCPTRAATKCKI